MRGQPPSIAFNNVRLGFGIFCLSFLAIAGAGAAYATPVTSIEGQVQTSGPSGDFQTFTVSGHGPIVDLLFVDGSHASASNAAFADFGTLGVGVAGVGLTPANSRVGVSSIAFASAAWDDTFTPRDFFLPAGTPVTANLILNLHFANVAQTLNARILGMNYDLEANITQGPGSRHPVTSTLVDDCFSIDFRGAFCTSGSHRFRIPGNTDPEGITLELAPILLSLAIDQPFELGVQLDANAEGLTRDRSAIVGAYNFSGDALDTSEAFLQPLQAFNLVSESGHDYSPPSGHRVPEPSSLALLFAGLLSAVRWRRSAR